MDTDWENLAGWWREEVAADPSYRDEVLSVLLDLLDPQPACKYLDIGCGEGRVMRELQILGSGVVGCDLNHDLLCTAAEWE